MVPVCRNPALPALSWYWGWEEGEGVKKPWVVVFKAVFNTQTLEGPESSSAVNLFPLPVAVLKVLAQTPSGWSS